MHDFEFLLSLLNEFSKWSPSLVEETAAELPNSIKMSESEFSSPFGQRWTFICFLKVTVCINNYFQKLDLASRLGGLYRNFLLGSLADLIYFKMDSSFSVPKGRTKQIVSFRVWRSHFLRTSGPEANGKLPQLDNQSPLISSERFLALCIT